MNTEITKYKNSSANDLLENRILQLEKQLAKLTMINDRKLNNSDAQYNHSGVSNIPNSYNNNLSLSEGQLSAHMALAMSRSSQRNS